MIRYSNAGIELFIKWINDNYAVDLPVYITILHGYDYVESEDGGSGFAVYMPSNDKPIMMVAGEMSPKLIEDGVEADFFYECIAHEYKHHIQFINNTLNNSEENEIEAEEFAKQVVEKYLSGE